MSCKDGGALLPGGSGLQQSKQETVGMKAEGHRLERLFHQLDTNGDGRIDIHELFQGLNRLGYAHISEEQVEVRRHFFHQQKSACEINTHALLLQLLGGQRSKQYYNVNNTGSRTDDKDQLQVKLSNFFCVIGCLSVVSAQIDRL